LVLGRFLATRAFLGRREHQVAKGKGAARAVAKLIRDFGVPRDNFNGKGDDMDPSVQSAIAQKSQTQSGRIGGR
jgi:hypothetical protein